MRNTRSQSFARGAVVRNALRSAFLVATLLAATTASSAAAQRAAPDTLDAPVPLPEITVTVLRTPLSLTRVPYAVSVSEITQIQRAKPGLGLDEALRGIPGVQVDNRYNYALGERISIRGFGARSQFGVRGVKVLVDGIPATLPDGQTALSHVDLGFLRRAEVIRGPASSLWGNTAGGVIQLESERAPPVPLSQEVGVIAGSNGLLRAHSTTGGRSGRASYLLNVSRLAYDGYRDFNEAENFHLNARLGWEGERSRVRFLANAVDYDADNPGSLSAALLEEDRSQAFTRNRLQRTGETGRQAQLGATWEREAGGGEWEVTGYALTRQIANPIPPAIIDLERTAGGARALYRARLLSSLQWTAGAEADVQRDDRRNFRNEEGDRGALVLDQLETVTNAAVFAQLSAAPLPRVSLLGGLRYDWFRFDADDRFLGAGNPDDSGSRTLDAISPSLGLTYSASDALNLYGNVATAFETPTTTELANRPSGAGGFNPELEPQEALSFEVGAKGRMGSRLSYQLAAYRAEIKNALISFQVPGAEGRDFFRNAGSAVHEGLEASTTLSLLPGSSLQTAYTYTDARFDEYVVDGDVLDGNRLPGVAPHRADVSLTYEAPFGWFASLGAQYASAIPVDDANTVESPAYATVDLRTGIERIRLGAVEVEPFLGVTNLFDREYNTSVVINAFGGRFFEPGPGRALYLGMNLSVGQK